MKYRFNKNVPLLPVEGVPKVGAHYHVEWGYSRGIVGVCISVDTNLKTVRLRTPKTMVDFKNAVKWSDLRHTRSTQVKINRLEAKRNRLK